MKSKSNALKHILNNFLRKLYAYVDSGLAIVLWKSFIEE